MASPLFRQQENHEYTRISRQNILFIANGIPVPKGYVASTPMEAEFAYRRLKSEVAVVKAQIHAGGRGKAGGVKLVKSAAEAHDVTAQLLGATLVTHQTGPEGKVVNKVYIEAGSNITKEYYLALLVDRETASITIVSSRRRDGYRGCRRKTPERIISIPVDPL